ncbi:acylphosphatase-1-like [Toxorhynchites rutilus septentrionalis]|uniref:acylphosphatase-1-like n=1 Tax=Toxorhynchites rutilus septentrionalis TaxID=329112 RepID=UPI00247A70C9|nr:acylphosphatase-1-like [Toxorhynchites rutilus septentrionalis]XP_055638286.1 acylphosphatase-1-like [Toxorhynchites rutilus septentrionalis]
MNDAVIAMRRREVFILILSLLATRIRVTTVSGDPQQSLLGCPASDLFTCEQDSIRQRRSSTMAGKPFACDFEIFGTVQGVFFRKYTQKQATSLGLRGWCMNTHAGTVKGQMEGEEKPMNEMKHWLKTKGSPSSHIDKAVFGEMKEISKCSFNDFSIKR